MSWVYWCFMSHATIFQSYMWQHRCAGGLKKKLYLRSGSQRHRHFVGFFNVPVLHRHGTTLFIRVFRHTAQFSRLLRHAGDTEDVFSTSTPVILTGVHVWYLDTRKANLCSYPPVCILKIDLFPFTEYFQPSCLVQWQLDRPVPSPLMQGKPVCQQPTYSPCWTKNHW